MVNKIEIVEIMTLCLFIDFSKVLKINQTRKIRPILLFCQIAPIDKTDLDSACFASYTFKSCLGSVSLFTQLCIDFKYLLTPTIIKHKALATNIMKENTKHFSTKFQLIKIDWIVATGVQF